MKNLLVCALLFLLFFAIPFEYKYDKFLRFYSLTLIPQGFTVPEGYDKNIYCYPSDAIALLLFGFGFWRMRGRMFERGVVWLGLVAVFSAVSIAFSPMAHYPIAYIRLVQLITPTAIFAFLANGPIEGKKLMQIGTWGLFASGMMQSLIAMPQYLLQRSLGLCILSEQPLFSGFSLVPSGK